jgi:hypothetical protein
VSSTDTTFDPATIYSGTVTDDWIFSPTRLNWYPIIRGAQDDPPSDDSGASTDGDGSSDDTSGATDDSSSSEDEKKLTQSEVNAIVAREVAKASRGKLDLKELGFDSKKDLQSFLEGAKEKAEADKTEADKQLEEAVAKATEAARSEVLNTAGELVLKAEFLIAAKDADVKYPHDAYELVQTLKEWDEVDIDEDGSVVGIDETLFASLKKAKPFLFEQPSGSDIGAGSRGGGSNNGDDLRAKYPALKNFTQ